MFTKIVIFLYRRNWIGKLCFWGRQRPPSPQGAILGFPNRVFRHLCTRLAHRCYEKLGEISFYESVDNPLPRHLGGHFGITHIDEEILVYLKEKFSIESMIDIGCGPGGQVEVARSLGIEAFGIDGDSTIKYDKPYFFYHDFAQGKASIDKTFDLAWSVEFLEHVEEKFQPFYMDLFVKAKIVVCTAAFPGQGGYHHVNERDTKYWIDVFKKYKLQYNHQVTKEVKKHSSMRAEFLQTTGMVFINTRTIGKSLKSN